jgi:NAD-dependent SIR2 family protein deacetylase
VVRNKQVDKAVELLRDKNIMVVTGAGVSTDSGIPDYRGRGMLSKFPLYADKFVSDPIWRKKFWIRGARQWDEWADAAPNITHEVVSAMEHTGHVTGVVTQNVDGLHYDAGSLVVAEIHGNMFTSSCMKCGETYSQADVIEDMWLMNPKLANKRVIAKTFVEPMCSQCGFFLKPDVVFFGDLLPEDQLDLADGIADDSDAVLVLGTSMAVGTSMENILRVRKKKGPIVVVNRGRTYVDNIADVKLNMGLADVLPEIGAGVIGNRADALVPTV